MRRLTKSNVEAGDVITYEDRLGIEREITVRSTGPDAFVARVKGENISVDWDDVGDVVAKVE